MSDLIDAFTTTGTNKGLYYGGAFRAAKTDAVVHVTNPATATVFTTVPDGTLADVDAAVAAARSAFGDWSALDPIDRARHLRRFADVIRENIPKLAVLETIVTGRALKEMKAQMGRIPEWIEYFAGIAMGLEGESNVIKGNYVTMTHYTPLGPVALLTPWNHPILILVKKMGAALAAGNTCVVKPSELAPVSPLVLAALATEAGLPDGVVNVVTGGPPSQANVWCAPRWNLGARHPLLSVRTLTWTERLQEACFRLSWHQVRPVCPEHDLWSIAIFMISLSLEWRPALTRSHLAIQWTTAPKWGP